MCVCVCAWLSPPCRPNPRTPGDEEPHAHDSCLVLPRGACREQRGVIYSETALSLLLRSCLHLPTQPTHRLRPLFLPLSLLSFDMHSRSQPSCSKKREKKTVMHNTCSFSFSLVFRSGPGPRQRMRGRTWNPQHMRPRTRPAPREGRSRPDGVTRGAPLFLLTRPSPPHLSYSPHLAHFSPHSFEDGNSIIIKQGTPDPWPMICQRIPDPRGGACFAFAFCAYPAGRCASLAGRGGALIFFFFFFIFACPSVHLSSFNFFLITYYYLGLRLICCCCFRSRSRNPRRRPI